MVTCAHCAAVNPSGGAFCRACGATLQAAERFDKTCPLCPAHFSNPAEYSGHLAAAHPVNPAKPPEEPQVLPAAAHSPDAATLADAGTTAAASTLNTTPASQPPPLGHEEPTGLTCAGCGTENPVGLTHCVTCWEDLTGMTRATVSAAARQTSSAKADSSNRQTTQPPAPAVADSPQQRAGRSVRNLLIGLALTAAVVTGITVAARGGGGGGNFDVVAYVGEECGVNMNYMWRYPQSYTPPHNGKATVAWDGLGAAKGTRIIATFPGLSTEERPESVSCY